MELIDSIPIEHCPIEYFQRTFQEPYLRNYSYISIPLSEIISTNYGTCKTLKKCYIQFNETRLSHHHQLLLSVSVELNLTFSNSFLTYSPPHSTLHLCQAGAECWRSAGQSELNRMMELSNLLTPRFS